MLLDDAQVSETHAEAELTGYIAFEAKHGKGLGIRNIAVARLPWSSEPFGSGAQKLTGAVVAPTVLESAKPFYPVGPLAAGIEGTVRLAIVIDVTGRVSDARVMQALDPDLDEAALACAHQWRFRPATVAGKPIRCIATLELSFTIGRR